MLRLVVCYLIFGVAFFVTAIQIVKPGPRYPPTSGEVWPKPREEAKESYYFTFNPANFRVKVTSNTCTILTNAIERCIHVLGDFYGIYRRHRKRRFGDNACVTSCINVQDDNYKGLLAELEIELIKPCEDYPHFEMDEKYQLTVSDKSKLKTSSIWGALRGLETFAQLFYFSEDNTEIRVNSTSINDYPNYAHRGLLLDTARHYISIHNIKLSLDAMAINKMNVLHWHIVDDQSFPYQSEKFPDLSRLGAYDKTMVYTKEDIKKIINYARDRGIRVVPEFDVPGHTASWGVAYPNILTECYQFFKVVGLGPMNPIDNNTYKLLRNLFEEIQEWFPDNFIHVGGDEVDLSCWTSNPDILYYMLQKNMSSVNDLHALFMQKTIPLLNNRSVPIVWQEVFDNKVRLPNNTIVQVWKYGAIPEMFAILQAGYRVLFSSSWYLDQLSKGGNWQDYYAADPRDMVKNPELAKNIVGGEACMWGEMVDDRNVISRVWPRASAVAERLWSDPISTVNTTNSNFTTVDQIPVEVYHRLEEHTCRMLRRGISAQPPSGPGFCIAY